MKHYCVWIVAAILLVSPVFAAPAATESNPASYARIAVLRPNDGDTVDFEAGYIRHLEWHRQAGDSWSWYGWNIWASDRQRWFVYASFGHTAEELGKPVSPAEDERDNISNVTPHAKFVENAVYEFLPQLSRGSSTPTPMPRLELTTVEINSGAGKAFEAMLRTDEPNLQGETLWYRMVAGGNIPRYVRLRPRPTITAILDERSEQALPDKAIPLIAKMTIEILNLRPTMSYNLKPAN
jgi:hypothetical protein